jgi:hypothetical protein
MSSTAPIHAWEVYKDPLLLIEGPWQIHNRSVTPPVAAYKLNADEDALSCPLWLRFYIRGEEIATSPDGWRSPNGWMGESGGPVKVLARNVFWVEGWEQLTARLFITTYAFALQVRLLVT